MCRSRLDVIAWALRRRAQVHVGVRCALAPGHGAVALSVTQRFLGIEARVEYQGVERLVARWRPRGGSVYCHVLLDSLSEAGLVTP